MTIAFASAPAELRNDSRRLDRRELESTGLRAFCLASTSAGSRDACRRGYVPYSLFKMAVSFATVSLPTFRPTIRRPDLDRKNVIGRAGTP